MERYDSYKDSGVDWIGQIPEHWNVTPLFCLMDEISQKNEYCTVTNQLQFKFGSIVEKSNQVVDSAVAKIISSYTIVNTDDIIINGLNLNYDFVTQRVAKVTKYGVITSAYICLRPKNLTFPCYFNYLLKTMDNKKMLNSMGTGIRQTLSYKQLRHINLSVPPISEQQAIVAYLDEETGKLDAAVEKLERMVEVLKERKQLIISKAVTRGLEDSVPLKDSGLEWIGQIPEHWSINRFKDIFTLNTGISFTKADLVETGQPVISYGQVHSKLNQVAKANLSLIKYIPQPLTIGKQKSYCLPNDFIFADTSEDFDGCGNNFYNDSDSELSVFAGSHTILAKLRCNIEGKYLAYLFSTSLWRQQIRSRVNGVKVFSITQSILKATSVILPPIAEQQAIAAYLDEKVGKLDEAIEKQLRMIELLKERKQILISDVVTGKIKVA